jgi:hypothetical protein
MMAVCLIFKGRATIIIPLSALMRQEERGSTRKNRKGRDGDLRAVKNGKGGRERGDSSLFQKKRSA